MNCFSSDIQQILQQAFNESDLSIQMHVDHASVISVRNLTENKIRAIIHEVGFCPFITQGSDGNFAFTVVPYALPDLFKQATCELHPILSQQVILIYQTVNENLLHHENLFTQGRTDEGYSAHFERNRRNILSLAEGLCGEALLLGFGNGRDTPLAQLATQFDRVTIVDIDMFSVNKAITKLPPHLQGKIIPIQKDLTGILGLISEKIENFDSEVSDIECLNRLSQIIIEGMHNRECVALTKKYQLVVSSMLTSQLFSEIHRYVMDVSLKKYPRIQEKQSSTFTSAISQLGFKVCQSHLDDLANWTLSNGRIYYADTTKVDTMEAEFGWGPKGLAVRTKITKTNEALPNEEINRKIHILFSSLREVDTWKWNTQGVQVNVRSKPPVMLSPGCRMHVAAYFLQPKSEGEA